jgi:hypothetical protein
MDLKRRYELLEEIREDRPSTASAAELKELRLALRAEHEQWRRELHKEAARGDPVASEVLADLVPKDSWWATRPEDA